MSTSLPRIYLARAPLPILVFLIHSFLAFNHVIGNDEGVALYTGRVILEGGAPYLDSWDHKGPVLYFLNAVGFWISQNAVWGPGILEGLFLAFAVSLSIHNLLQFWSPFVVYSLIIAFLISYYFFLESLNLTESWTHGFQMVAYLLIFIESNRRTIFDSGRVKSTRLFFILGLIFSLIFYTRPNNSMGVLFATITFSVLFQKSNAIKGLMVFSLTFFSFSFLIWLYLNSNGSFSQFIEQFVVYNLDYSSAGNTSDRFNSALHSLYRLIQTPLSLLMVTTLISIILYRSSWFEIFKRTKINIAILVGLIGDFLFSFLSARGYLHYMIVILPGLMIVVGILQSYFAERSMAYRRFISLVLVVCILSGGLFGTQKAFTRFYSDPGDLVEVSKFLINNSVDTDYVQILGSDTRILVMAHRKSSSSITYSNPATSVFYRNAKQTAWKVESDVKSKNPKYIVRNIKGSCELDRPTCGLGTPQYDEENLATLYSWILRNYQRIAIIGDYEIWNINGPR